jgi:hypothetical protein
MKTLMAPRPNMGGIIFHEITVGMINTSSGCVEHGNQTCVNNGVYTHRSDQVAEMCRATGAPKWCATMCPVGHIEKERLGRCDYRRLLEKIVL